MYFFLWVPLSDDHMCQMGTLSLLHLLHDSLTSDTYRVKGKRKLMAVPVNEIRKSNLFNEGLRDCRCLINQSRANPRGLINLLKTEFKRVEPSPAPAWFKWKPAATCPSVGQLRHSCSWALSLGHGPVISVFLFAFMLFLDFLGICHPVPSLPPAQKSEKIVFL